MLKVGDTVKYVGDRYAYMGLSCGKVIELIEDRMGHIVAVKWPCLPEPVVHSSSALEITNQEQTEQKTIGLEDSVRKPSHYQVFDGVESIEIIARSMTVSEFRGFCMGNVLKYRLRAGKKSELATMEKDLNKAAFYQELFDQHKGKCHA